MITITNVGPHDDKNKLGERDYEVRINGEVHATFKHKRGEGLAVCLKKAGEAVERKKWLAARELFDKLPRTTKKAPQPKITRNVSKTTTPTSSAPF